jgi:hypothetical protein
MTRQTMGRLGVLVAVGLLMAAGAALAADQPAITADKLVYQGATVETQVDVNGEAAMQLVGGVIDALAAQAKAQAEAMAAGGKPGEGPMAMLPAAVPLIEPAKEAIKSLSQITVVVQRPQAPVKSDEFLAHYREVMAPLGWSPLLTLKTEDGTAVAGMVAPEGKGVFFAVNEGSEIVAALITTTKPIGELIGQVIQASGGSWPMIMSQIGRGRAPTPPAPPAPKPKAAPKKKK